MSPNESALREAMDRLLAGDALRHKGPLRKADGSLHVSGWAAEAGLGSTVPYRFKDLMAQFKAALDHHDDTAADRYEARLARLSAELAVERERARRYRAERDATRTEMSRLVSLVALMDREAEIARAERVDVVRPLRRAITKESR